MSTGGWRFYDFELDLRASRLSRNGDLVHLERIPLELLCLLVERCGQTVTRDQILERIWGKGVFIDSENAINTAVRKIRRALNDDVNAPRFIFTIPGKGYRFIAAASAPDSAASLTRRSESAATYHGSTTIPVTDSQAGERRHLTVLVCELTAAAGPAPQPDPEDWWENVAYYHRAAIVSIGRYGGYVGSYRGDAMMVCFGWPTAHDNDAERAVLAALAIIEEVVRLNERSPGPNLSARIGIDSGAVVLVADPDHQVDFFGDTPSIALDLQRATLPGTVLMTDATRRLTSGLFVVEDCGECLRNRTQVAIRVYRAIRPSGARNRFEAVAAVHGLIPFIGREAELRLLMNRWECTLEGEGQAILITGEPGIGKSRLVQHFHQQIARTNHTWAEAAAGAFFQNTPFYPVSELLRQILAVSPDEPVDAQLAHLESALKLCGVEPVEAVPLIAMVLNLPVPEKYPSLSYSGDRQRRRLLATLAETVRNASRIQPLVVAVEDLHWADPSTLELLQLLVEQGATARLLLLHTGRPEFHPQWALTAHHVHITLSKLSERDARTMINQVALNESLPEETVLTLVERTGGVPLFIEELTRVVLESGNRSANREIPATLHNSLLARLDRLDRAKEIAQVASVIGRNFSYELLQAVHPVAEDELQRGLAKLAEADLVYVRGIPPEATYTFKHALIRDAAYEALLKSRRRDLHRRFAEAISEKFAALAEEHPEILARHWTEAGDRETAISEWNRAGKVAEARYAFAEAHNSYNEALALVQLLPPSPDRDRREVEIRYQILATLSATRGHAAPETLDASERFKVVAEKSGDLRALFMEVFTRGITAWVSGNLAAACQLADEALALALRQESREILASAYSLEIWTRYWRGDLTDVEKHFAAGTKFFDSLPPTGQSLGSLPSFAYASWSAWTIGHANTAREREAQMMARVRTDHPYDRAYSAALAARLRLYMREFEQAEGLAARALEVARENQFPYLIALSRCLLGRARAQLSRSNEDVAQIRDGITGLLEISSRFGIASHTTYLAEAQTLKGAFAEALVTIQQALQADPDELAVRPETLRVRGEIQLTLGQSALAEASFREAIMLARQMDAKAWQLRATVNLARLLRNTPLRNEARGILAETYNWFTEGFDTADLMDAKALLDELGT